MQKQILKYADSTLHKDVVAYEQKIALMAYTISNWKVTTDIAIAAKRGLWLRKQFDELAAMYKEIQP